MNLLLFVIVIGILFNAACGGSPTTPSAPPSTSGPSLPVGVTSADLAFCLNETNRYRATIGLAALTESTTLDAFAQLAAESDGSTHVGHGYINSHPPTATHAGENEIPWWPLDRYGTVQAIIQAGFAGMWAEGPPGGHYRNMSGAFTQAGCGIAIIQSTVTVVQEFR